MLFKNYPKGVPLENPEGYRLLTITGLRPLMEKG
jgi:hypothetical protein